MTQSERLDTAARIYEALGCYVSAQHWLENWRTQVERERLEGE